MEQRLLGFFSGFPERRFPREIAGRLGGTLACRESLVFLSAWPEDHGRNDGDAAGMYGMFLEYGLEFGQWRVIDSRTKAPEALGLVRGASCLFLMGGHPGLQMGLIRTLGLGEAIRACPPVVLGVSAGAINMARRSLDTKESLAPYQGLGLADITVKPHFAPSGRQVLDTLLEASRELPVCAMEDDSAIFVEDGAVSYLGRVYWVDKGKISPLF